ncbi:hypothetical protein Dfri01_15620 [Dyadobacter frigoris]|nr:hypothetical protein Dfri01_15620 [Dyadobacter frigoris]
MPKATINIKKNICLILLLNPDIIENVNFDKFVLYTIKYELVIPVSSNAGSPKSCLFEHWLIN